MLHLDVGMGRISIPNSMNDHSPKPLPLVPLPLLPLPLLPLPFLYTYRRCPYAMRARMALWVAKRDFHAHEIDLRNKPAAMLALSPKGTVPVLRLVDGRVLDESWDIMRWALDTHTHTHTHTHDDIKTTQPWWQLAQSAQNLALLHCNDGEFKRHLDRYKYPQREALNAVGRAAAGEVACEVAHDLARDVARDVASDATRNAARDAAVAALLNPLEAALRSQLFLGGSQACATDLAIFPFVRQFATVDAPWFQSLPLPMVQAWLSAWLGSGVFAACMAKLPP